MYRRDKREVDHRAEAIAEAQKGSEQRRIRRLHEREYETQKHANYAAEAAKWSESYDVNGRHIWVHSETGTEVRTQPGVFLHVERLSEKMERRGMRAEDERRLQRRREYRKRKGLPPGMVLGRTKSGFKSHLWLPDHEMYLEADSDTSDYEGHGPEVLVPPDAQFDDQGLVLPLEGVSESSDNAATPAKQPKLTAAEQRAADLRKAGLAKRNKAGKAQAAAKARWEAQQKAQRRAAREEAKAAEQPVSDAPATGEPDPIDTKPPRKGRRKKRWPRTPQAAKRAKGLSPMSNLMEALTQLSDSTDSETRAKRRAGVLPAGKKRNKVMTNKEKRKADKERKLAKEQARRNKEIARYEQARARALARGEVWEKRDPGNGIITYRNLSTNEILYEHPVQQAKRRFAEQAAAGAPLNVDDDFYRELKEAGKNDVEIKQAYKDLMKAGTKTGGDSKHVSVKEEFGENAQERDAEGEVVDGRLIRVIQFEDSNKWKADPHKPLVVERQGKVYDVFVRRQYWQYLRKYWALKEERRRTAFERQTSMEIKAEEKRREDFKYVRRP